MYHQALMLRTGGRGLRCTLPHGEIVRVLPEHRYLSWNPSEYEAFRRAVRPGMTALDIGANVGAYSVLLGQWVGPSGRVVAFEPAPAPFKGLVRHLAMNRLEHVVTPVAAAVGDRDATASLLLSTTAGESRLAAPSDRDREATTVPLVTIDSFCHRERIDPGFIKIDVEGWELFALHGARDTIRRRGRDLALFVEMHPSVWPLLGIDREAVVAEIAEQSLEVSPLTPVDDLWAVEGVSVLLRPR
jgi:FkbM family methyltransferase